MVPILGEISLVAVLLAATAAVLTSVAAYRQRSERLLKIANRLIGAVALLFTVSAVILAIALVRSDFRLEYVAGYTERALPWGYKLAALWAGQEGSLLLWGWMLAVLAAMAMRGFRRLSHSELCGTCATLGVVCAFFGALIVFAANPFDVFAGGAPADGRGLNPQLQDPGMIIHPPLLFLGYSGYAIPFAVLVGVLVAGRGENRWLADVRRWLLVSWFFLTAGIVVGAWWAYVELGWGGYWAWDPVENASLLPWLTGTALLHSIMVQQHRGMFKVWNAMLLAASWILCLFGTYLTRSGVIDSVHAFAPSLIGTFFFVFIVASVVISLGLMIWRRRLLRTEHELEGMISREGAFWLANVLLVVMTLTTLIGTIWPLISGTFGDAVTVKPGFYNRVVAPMAVALVAIMALGPVLVFGKSAASRILHSLIIPGIVAVLAMVLAAITITTNAWAILCIGITVLGTVTVIEGFVRSVGARGRSTGEGLFVAAVRLVDKDHRRYGGQTAHLGAMLLVIGIAASSLFSVEETFTLAPGGTAQLGDVEVTFVELRQERAVNYTAIEAPVEVRRDGQLLDVLYPQCRYYDAWGDDPNTEVAIRSSWKRDIYVSVAGWENGGAQTAIQVRLNPGVMWIWNGGIVMGLGALLSLAPPLLRRTRTAPVAAGADTEASKAPAPPAAEVESPVVEAVS